MRPQRNAAENIARVTDKRALIQASMRPQRNAAENGYCPYDVCEIRHGFNEAAA